MWRRLFTKMPVPEFNEIKAPALEFFADEKPHKISEVYKVLVMRFKLTEQDLSEVLPSGRQSRWHNRANWACYDLYRAGLLDRPKRGLYVITELGKKVAERRLAKIDRDYLMQFPQFAEWIAEKESDSKPKTQAEQSIAMTQTPNEVIEAAHRSLRAALRSEVLDLIRKMDPYRFEQVVVDVLVAMGYGGSREEAAHVTQKSNDEGVDGLINEDRLGLDRIYVQAKRWQKPVGRPELQNFVGALAGQQAHKGIFITTGEFGAVCKENCAARYFDRRMPVGGIDD